MTRTIEAQGELARGLGPSTEPDAPSRDDARRLNGSVVLIGLALLAGVPAFSGLVSRFAAPPAFVVVQAIACLLLPGWLLLLAMGVSNRTNHESASSSVTVRFARLIMSACLSVILLMLTGLVANVLLSRLGVSRPLAPSRLGPLLAATNYVLLVAVARRGRVPEVRIRCVAPTPGIFFLYAIPPALVAAAVLGATRLNNHHSSAIAVATLIAVAIYMLFVLLAPGLPDTIYPYSLGLLALTLLLQLSLRGNVISGHDVLSEFKVYRATQAGYHWNVADAPTAYTACLSITVLPVFIHGVVWVSGSFFFRVIAQMLFALVPVIVFVGARRHVSERMAYGAGLFFVAQSPFIGDFPFLVRQEVALLLFGAFVLVLVSHDPPSIPSSVLLLVLGIGIVVSHYSTTYVTLAILGVALALRMLERVSKRPLATANRVIRRGRRGPKTPHWQPGDGPEREARGPDPAADIHPTGPTSITGHGRLTPTLVGFLTAATLVWTALVTHTTSNLHAFVSDLSLPQPPSVSVLLAGRTTPPSTDRYILSVSRPAQAAPGRRYTPAQIGPYQGQQVVKQAVGKRLPRTAASAIYTIGSGIRDLVKLLVFVGAFWLARNRRRLGLAPGHAALLLASLIVVVAALILPAVSVEYDAGRVYQQTLVVLSLCAVVGALVTARRLRLRRAAPLAVMLVVFAAYLAVSPVVPQLVGSGYANMQLNNYGPYYAVYYGHGDEVRAIKWLDQTGARATPTYADAFATKKIVAFSGRQIWIVPNVVPGNIVRNSYVFVDDTNLRDGVAYAMYNGAMINYAFPTRLSALKDVLFSAGSVRVLR